MCCVKLIWLRNASYMATHLQHVSISHWCRLFWLLLLMFFSPCLFFSLTARPHQPASHPDISGCSHKVTKCEHYLLFVPLTLTDSVCKGEMVFRHHTLSTCPDESTVFQWDNNWSSMRNALSSSAGKLSWISLKIKFTNPANRMQNMRDHSSDMNVSSVNNNLLKCLISRCLVMQARLWWVNKRQI